MKPEVCRTLEMVYYYHYRGRYYFRTKDYKERIVIMDESLKSLKYGEKVTTTIMMK
jgi:hypothetical protein